GALLHTENLQHSYPHCWRCHNPIIFRATEQWFISMETPMQDGTLRSRALQEIKKVKWDPGWGEERISNMIANRPDWCISRQRIWGVPIAVFLCEGCGKPLNNPEINRKVVELFARDGADSWYSGKPDALVRDAKCPACSGTKFTKETDILDVWFESGCSYLAVREAEPAFPWPSDLYTEGGDQHRGWFHSSLLCTVATRESAPYKMVATSGWTLDEQGRAMSKSLGNVVDPVEIANRLGAEIVRLWVASVDFREDVTCSEQLMQRVADNYRKIRNTLKNVLGNLYDFDPERDAVPFKDMEAIDQYMLRQTVALSTELTRWYDEFAFHKIYHRVNHFCVVDLSAFYFDVLKDRLYTFTANSPGRRSAQTAMWRIAEALIRLLAPVTSFTCDEVWRYLPAMKDRFESVHLSKFPTDDDIFGGRVADNPGQLEDWATLLAVREQVLKSLEEARNEKLIGVNLGAQVTIVAPEPVFSVLARYKEQLRYLFIVSAVAIEAGSSGNGNAGLNIKVSKADGQKCERCWNYSIHVGDDSVYPTVCERCSPRLKEIESAATAAP
ncbi:MAG: isoleucine--tRNA ligase, partial [Terriglobales bacterium]